MTTPTAHVIFLCWGNICRSPMAERIARGWAERLGRADLQFTSAGTSTENLGSPIDPRAARVLRRAGFDASVHAAHQITADEARAADLVVAMDPLHVELLAELAGGLGGIRTALLTDFDPDAEEGSGVVDPWYGDAAGFDATFATLERAMPGLFARMGVAADA